MKTLKRIVAGMLVLLLMVTAIPENCFSSLALSSNKNSTVEETVQDEVEVEVEESTKHETEKEIVSIKETEPETTTYTMATSTAIITESGSTISRAEWIHNLAVVFDMMVESSALPDNYFPDLKTSHKYYEDILLAVTFGVINVEEGTELCPDDAVTRDFAVSTLNFCLGYQLPEDVTYTFSDSESCSDPTSAQIAINRGWVEVIDGCFSPETYLTTEEVEFMIADTQEVLEGQIVDENHENVYEFAEGVIEISEGTVVEEDENGVVTITNSPKAISVGDKFAVYFNGIPSVYTAQTVTVNDTVTVIETKTVESDEAFETVDAEGIIGTDAMEIIPAEGVEVKFEEDNSGTSTYAIKKTKNLTTEIPLSFGGVTAKVSVKIKNPYVEYDVEGDKAYAKFYATTETTYSISGNVMEMGGLKKGLTLFTVNVLGVGSFDIMINVDFSGSASGTVKGDLLVGVECSKSGGIRAIKNFVQKESYTNAEASAAVSLRAALGITKMPVLSASVYAEVGIRASFSKKTYTDDKSPKQCVHHAAYLYANYGASASAKLGPWKTSESVSYTIYNESNSPVRIVNHYEDGNLVAKCTRGNVYKSYYTTASSRWSGCGWTGANGTYALNADGTPFVLYSYTLDENNQATITKYNGNAWSVYIPEEIDGYTVVGIGYGAFENKDVSYVVIPEGVTSMGNRAFGSCSALKSINIPKDLEYAGSNAFNGALYGCSSLRDVTFEEGITRIADSLFGYTGIESITIPDTVTEIGKQTFGNCEQLQTVELSKNLSVIGYYAFGECNNLTSIELPKTMTRLENHVFYGCTSLAEINIPKNLEYAGANAFNGALYGCSSLKNVVFEEGITTIVDALFGYTGIESITIPDTVTEIGEQTFGDCKQLQTVELSKNLSVIGYYAFGECNNLTSIELPKTMTRLENHAFYGCTSLAEINIPKNLEYAGANAFNGALYGCSSLKDVTFEEGITRIADSLFGYTGIESITIPDTVTEIGEQTFGNCEQLQTVELSKNLSVIGYYAFGECNNLTSIELPKTMTRLENHAFYGCTSLVEINIPKNLKYAGANAFNGALYGCSGLRNVIFEEGITTIVDALFGYSGIENVTIPTTLVSIGFEAFYKCENLKTVLMSDSVTTIKQSAFYGCRNLVDITLPKILLTIEDSLFYDCLSLATIDIPSSVTKIESYAFGNCALKNVEIPDSVTIMGSYTFDGCTSLESVKLPNTRENIMSYMFRNCTSLKTIEFPETVTTIQSYAFDGCTALESFSFVDELSLKEVQDYAFRNCTSLKEVILPKTTKTIGSRVFQNCTELEKVYIPQSTKTLGSYAFQGCEKLSDVTIADYSIKTIEAQTFKDCPGLQKIVLPKGLTSIKSQAFMNCTSLIEVTIPESVTSIDATAFSYPDKTTIFGKSGSYAQTFANENGFKFVDISVPAEGIALLDGVEYVVMDRGETYRAVFEFYPEDTTDVITLTANNSNVTIDGHDIYARYTGDTVITATASSGVSYEFTIHIRYANKIAITKQPNKLSYIMGEELDLTGMVAQVTYNDGSTREVTDYMVSGFDSSVEGQNAVTVKWIAADGYSYTTTFTVEIVDPRPKLTGIVIDTLPLKREYARKESLDLTGLVIKATYTDGSSAEVTDYTVSGYNALKTGVQTITVTYQEFTTTFTVAVGQTLTVLGDVNGDKVIDAGDAVLISMYDAGFVTLTADQLTAGDVNKDGIVDAGDAVLVSMYDAGFITEF